MGQTLTEIADTLRDADKKVQLIYAFNATGKTRLSRAFKELVAPKRENEEAPEEGILPRDKILYYNAFTEDLFYWDNDLENDSDPILNIQPNTFTDWILRDRGQDRNIVTNFQRYTDNKLTPNFRPQTRQVTENDRRVNLTVYPSVDFSYDRGSDRHTGVKISKSEESSLIWSFFHTLLTEIISIRSGSDYDASDNDQFNRLEYVFIDDPVSSLDDNHLIELAFDLARLIRASPYVPGNKIKYIITTHNPLFYNVLCSEIDSPKGYFFKRLSNGTFDLIEKGGASNKSFSYHQHLKQTLEEAIASDQIEKYHFNLLRNLYEKTAHFLGYDHWTTLLSTAPDGRADYLKRLTNQNSHRDLTFEEVADPTERQKEDLRVLLANLVDNYGFWKQAEDHA